MPIDSCCDEFLERLRPVPSPPVTCPSCNRQITYELRPLKSSRSSNEYDQPQEVIEGYSISDPQYVHKTGE
jgi:hypothetical protein